jgi:hypothetical protein
LRTNCYDDSDGLKHAPYPFDPRYRNFKADGVIYVWNDPLLALLSLERRGWLTIQHKKLGGKRGFNSLTEVFAMIEREGADVYGFARHWRNRAGSIHFQFDWRSRDHRLEQFLGCQPLEDLRELPRTTYDLTQVPGRVKELYTVLDNNVHAARRTTALFELLDRAGAWTREHLGRLETESARLRLPARRRIGRVVGENGTSREPTHCELELSASADCSSAARRP